MWLRPSQMGARCLGFKLMLVNTNATGLTRSSRLLAVGVAAFVALAECWCEVWVRQRRLISSGSQASWKSSASCSTVSTPVSVPVMS